MVSLQQSLQQHYCYWQRFSRVWTVPTVIPVQIIIIRQVRRLVLYSCFGSARFGDLGPSRRLLGRLGIVAASPLSFNAERIHRFMVLTLTVGDPNYCPGCPCTASYTMHEGTCLHCRCSFASQWICYSCHLVQPVCVCTRCLSLGNRMAQ